jgi:hypothetical protein
MRAPGNAREPDVFDRRDAIGLPGRETGLSLTRIFDWHFRCLALGGLFLLLPAFFSLVLCAALLLHLSESLGECVSLLRDGNAPLSIEEFALHESTAYVDVFHLAAVMISESTLLSSIDRYPWAVARPSQHHSRCNVARIVCKELEKTGTGGFSHTKHLGPLKGFFTTGARKAQPSCNSFVCRLNAR